MGAQSAKPTKKKQKWFITPLFIIASFLLVTLVVMVYTRSSRVVETVSIASYSINVTDSSLSKVYENDEYHYLVRYPSSWYYEPMPNAKVMFSGKKGTPSYDSLISIQAIDPKLVNELFSNAADLMMLLKKQLIDMSSEFTILKEGEVELPSNPEKYYGQYFIATYIFEGTPFKKMQFVLQRNDGKAFYTWGYTSSTEQFDTDLPVVKAMYESWEIH